MKYSRKPGVEDTDIEAAIRHHLEKNPITPWFNPFQKVKVSRVIGRPWIEDLYRIPSQKLRVEFLPTDPDHPAVELTAETLYSLFRKYGKLRNIETQEPGSKVTPNYAYIEFARPKYAVMAKNCLHGYTVPEQEGGGKNGTKLKLRYERIIKASSIKDWLFNHPRIVIPAIAALIAGITVVIFDPVRTFFIELKIKTNLRTERNPTLQWVRDLASNANIMHLGLGRRKSDDRGLAAIWEGRQSDISLLQSWLTENIDTFIVVHGPRGSGKRELVIDQALENSKYKVIIDCKRIQEAKGDAEKISAAASQVGYRPVFSWMNNVSSFIDLATQGVIGTKAGFTQTLDAQLSKIWQNTSVALKRIALEGKGKDGKDSYLSDEEYLEAHPEKRPVVVIDNFLHNAMEQNAVYDKMTEWAAELVTGNIAHVIFLTTDISFSKTLSRALPNQVFRNISLGDCSLEVGRRFVLRHLQHDDEWSPGADKKTPEPLDDLDYCIETLGGRVTDLEFMAHRIKAGETPKGTKSPTTTRCFCVADQHGKAATNRIIDQAVFEILKIFLLEANTSEQPWNREQVWHLIKEIANSKDGVITYNKVLLSELFKKNGEASIHALEQAELVSVISVNGYPHLIKPSRPVFRAVFRRLTENKALSSRLDLAVLSELIRKENDKIKTFEEELRILEAMRRQPRELYPRITWLLQKVHKAQAKIGKYEEDSTALQAVLKAEQ